jgi:hypothetical protein
MTAFNVWLNAKPDTKETIHEGTPYDAAEVFVEDIIASAFKDLQVSVQDVETDNMFSYNIILDVVAYTTLT